MFELAVVDPTDASAGRPHARITQPSLKRLPIAEAPSLVVRCIRSPLCVHPRDRDTPLDIMMLHVHRPC